MTKDKGIFYWEVKLYHATCGGLENGLKWRSKTKEHKAL
jgi:hypothetical protein